MRNCLFPITLAPRDRMQSVAGRFVFLPSHRLGARPAVDLQLAAAVACCRAAGRLQDTRKGICRQNSSVLVRALPVRSSGCLRRIFIQL